MTYSPDGLDVELTVPLTHERWPGRHALARIAAGRRPERR